MDTTRNPGTQSALDEERQRLIAELLADEGLDASAPSIAPRDRSVATPLTYAQEVLWLLDRATPGLTAYNSALARRVRGTLDLPRLERALTALVERHEALRTVFEARGEQVVQTVLPASAVSLAVHDFRSTPVLGREAAAIGALRGVADTPFDLTKEPGFRAAVARIADDDHVLLLLTHHIVSDALSYGVIFHDLSALYAKQELPLPSLQFGDYAAWQRARLQGEALQQALGYWRDRLAGLPVLELPTDRPRPAVQAFAGARHTLTLSPTTHAAIRALAQRSGATTYMVLLAAYATVLHRYSAQDDIVIGSAVGGRTRRELEEMVGYFSQALPMRVRFDGDPTLAELLSRVTETVLGAFEHQDTPLESLVLELQQGRAESHAPLFRVVLTMQDTLGAELALGDAAISRVELDTAETKFDLTILASELTEGVELSLWFRTDLFLAATAERFLGHMARVLETALSRPETRVSQIDLLTAAERAQLNAWNETSIDEGKATTLVELFEAQAARVASRAAVVGPRAASSGVNTVTLTFAELNARANQLARQLRSLGVTADTPVGLLLDSTADAVVALVGILKAGGAYVPLSIDAPPARLAAQMRESRMEIVVTNGTFADRAAGKTVVALDRDAAALGALPDGNLDAVARPGSLAYVLYTSGSTGTPKGVAVTHANVVHYARAIAGVLATGLDGLDGWQLGLASTFAADLGNTSVMPSLVAGGTLHVLGKDVTTEPEKFAEYTQVHQLDVLKITPNHLQALAAGRRDADLAAILPRKWLVSGGEALRLDVARAVLGANKARLLNHYGPTETTVGVCTFEVTTSSLGDIESLGAQTVPVGQPIANTTAYVVDARGSEQPVGVPGELMIGGAGVTNGYLNRPELTAERFVDFRGHRVYRTGDRVRRLPNGEIEFLGRGDNQVKVRGYRVELAEIEAVLSNHSRVRQAVVALHEDMLVGYVVPTSENVDDDALTAHVSEDLPDYMVPAAWVRIHSIPLTPNGKIDRAALPKPSESARTTVDGTPRNETEQKLAAVWREVLKKESVGIHDNFFALGGHSLVAIRLLGRIAKTFGQRLSLRTLFENPTVAELAPVVLAGESSKQVNA
jgi:amino acid adenylation domain-containing protein